MDTLAPEVYLVQSPVFEFIASLFRLQCHTRLSREQEHEGLTDLDLDLWVQRVRSTLPNDILDTLETFFHYESYLGLSMVRFAWEKHAWSSVDRFFEVLAGTSPADLFQRFLNTGYTPTELPDPARPETVKDYLNRTNLPDTEKWKLAYLYLDLESAKRRFLGLLSFCYRSYFAEEWEGLRQQQAKSIVEVRQTIHCREDLWDVFPYLEGVPLGNPKATVVLAPSVFYHVDTLSSFDDEHLSFLSLYGVHYVGRASMRGDEAMAFFKVIADETRVKIIKTLALGPFFGYELAQQLKLSSSTISHHVSILADVGVVVPTREENRVSYALDREHLQSLLAAMAKHLLG